MGMLNDGFVQAAYVREVTLEHYGEGHPFGTYDRETGELIITDPNAMGELTVEWVTLYCGLEKRTGRLNGSHVLFGVPRKVYELREKVKYVRPEEL